MGRGDKKTAKGKRTMGSHGNTRPKTKTKAAKPQVKKEVTEAATEKKATTKKAAAPKTTVKKATTAKKPAPKKSEE